MVLDLEEAGGRRCAHSSDTPTIWCCTTILLTSAASCTPTRPTPPCGRKQRDIPCYGTTHADYFYGPVPCARALTEAEIRGRMEYNTGKIIYETFQQRGLSPVYIPAVLVKSHAPFAWGEDGAEAVHNAKVLEQVAMMASGTWPSLPARPRSIRRCWTSISCANTEKTPITARNELRPVNYKTTGFLCKKRYGAALTNPL